MMTKKRDENSMLCPVKPLMTLLPLGFVLLSAPGLAWAQGRAVVTVDLSKPLNVLTETSLSLPVLSSDASSFSLTGVPYLRAAGVTSLRYPGYSQYPGNNGLADEYHWSSQKVTNYKAVGGMSVAAEGNFASFALLAEKLGQATITVNYGSNEKGTGGGEPAEAAAWVAYANGSVDDNKALGKDSSGYDWKTVGFGAGLRSQAPLGEDDGLNFLRIQHPKPFGFKLWQVGDEVYNNGFYAYQEPWGWQHVGNPDLHGPAPTALKDFAKLKGNPKLSPATYGEGVKAFSAAMKAVDPSIQIGAGLVMPPTNLSWNDDVLKSACGAIDFVSLDWGEAPTGPSDDKTLNEAELLKSNAGKIGGAIKDLLSGYELFCAKGHKPRIAFARAGIESWVPKVVHPAVKALWLADTYALLIETGSVSANWGEMYGDTILSADHKRMAPAFYGLEMLHILVHAPGDVLVNASSSSPLLSVHASRRRDGYVGLMLVNKDPEAAATVKVSFKGGVPGTAGKRFEYGNAQFSAGGQLATTPFTAGGAEFSVTVPAYSITDIVLPAQ
jgi:hypothetical protein